MPSEFCYKVYLPSTDTYEYFKELNNKELLVVLKYNANDDKEGLSEYLESLIVKKSNKHIPFHRLDKFCIITTMIAVCIKNVINMTSKCPKTDKEYTTSINLTEVLNVISNIGYDGCCRTVKGDGVSIQLKFPDRMLLDNAGIKPIDIIDNIQSGEGIYNMCEFNDKEKLQVLESLPGSLVRDMMDVVNRYITPPEKAVFFTLRSPYDEESIKFEYSLSLLDNIFFDFIILILGSSLTSFYQMVHGLTVNNTLSVDYLMNITPAETQTYCDLIKNTSEAQSKQLEESQNPTG